MNLRAFQPEDVLTAPPRPASPASQAPAPSPEVEGAGPRGRGRSALPWAPGAPGGSHTVHPGGNPLIVASGLTKAYGATLALDGVDVGLGPGEALALLGPNGAGKTTLLRILATALRPTAGRALVLGSDAVREREAIRPRIALIAAASHLYEELTAAENLRFAAAMRGSAADEDEIDKALWEVGLEGARALRVRAFSGGMQRRLALAKVLLFQPSLLFLDEPYLSLDREAGLLLDRILLALKARGGGAVLATHQLGRAHAACERFAILVEGRLAWEGRKEGMTPEGLRAAYERAVEGHPA